MRGGWVAAPTAPESLLIDNPAHARVSRLPRASHTRHTPQASHQISIYRSTRLPQHPCGTTTTAKQAHPKTKVEKRPQAVSTPI